MPLIERTAMHWNLPMATRRHRDKDHLAPQTARSALRARSAASIARTDDLASFSGGRPSPCGGAPVAARFAPAARAAPRDTTE